MQYILIFNSKARCIRLEEEPHRVCFIVHVEVLQFQFRDRIVRVCLNTAVQSP
jgi:hypothetical protein